MSNKFEREMLGIAGGVATIEAAPQIAKNAFDGLKDATGSKIEFIGEELKNSKLGNLAEGTFDAAKGLVGPVAFALLVWAGLKKLFENDTEK